MRQAYPILEFDSTPEVILEPSHLIKPIDILWILKILPQPGDRQGQPPALR
jgi:hypothetical protein